MKPAPFEYHAPHSLEEALALKREHGDDGKPLAGGQSLIPAMNFRVAQPSILIDLVAQHAPLLHETIPNIAHPQIRNRGTIGGSLAHADPAAELPVVALALGARFRAKNADAERWLEVGDFFSGLFSVALEPDEILVEIAFPELPANTGWAFMEIARRSGDYAMAGVAALLT